MRADPAIRPSVALLTMGTVLLTLAGCGSSATTSTAPSPLVRCELTLSSGNQAIPATGGAGSVGVSATRECTWTVNVEGTWISLRSPQSGQGEGTVEFAAAANPDPAQRRGALILNGQRAEITQAAALCDISLAESAASFTPAGGSGRADVRASSALCTWSAASDASWIQIRSGSDGRGNGAVLFDVAATTGPPRSSTLTIAGQRFSVTQSEGCTFSIAPATHTAPAAGGNGTVVVTTTAACPWTAASNVPWIAVSPSTGSGPGPVIFTVDSTNGPARTGSALIAGHLFTVTQTPGCTYDVQPASHSVAASGGTARITVSSAAGCPWAASSGASWISIQGATSGAGSGAVTLSIAATTGPARTGTATIAGQQVTVSQGQGCTFSINPTQESIPSAGGNGKVAVTAGAGCGWTAASDVPWITVQSGASGSGDGAVTYTVAPTTGPGRTGTLTVAGQKVTVTQGQGCTFSINPTQQSVPAGGDGGKVAVTAADGCGWTASSSATWISIVSGATGTGAGDVQYMVAATTGPARAGTLTIAGQTFTVNQGQGCTFSIAPTSATVPDTGGQTSFDVQSATGCAWTASSQALWISIASGSSGSGNGTVQLTVAANTGPERTGTVTTAGTTFTVTQGAGCSYSLSPSSANLPAGGGNGTVNVSAPAGCTWNASSSAPWLTIANPPSGTGDGSVSFTAAANTSSSRSATLTIAGQTFMVNQTGCTYTVAPETVASPASGGPERIDITSATGCAWTATSNVPWIGIPGSASGSGDGTVDLSVAANTGPSRSGTATVAGRTVTVNQATGCTFSIAPPSARVVAAGGTTSVNVTAGAGCGWTAATSSTWIVVSNGAPGTGNGTVQLTVQANTTGATRSDTVLIAGHTFTVDQDK